MIFKRKKKQEKTIEYDSFGLSFGVPKPADDRSLFFLCLSKAIIIFCLLFGSIWFYFSCFEIKSYLWLVGIVVGIFCLIAGFLYYNKWTRNIGYFVVLLIFAGMAYFLYREANSGFAAILNQTYEVIDEIFILPSYNIFSESLNNRVWTVTVCAIFLGSFGSVILNILISRHMSFWFSFLILAPFLALAMYFEGTPAPGAVFLLAVAVISIFVLRNEHRFFLTPGRSDYRIKRRRNKPERYLYFTDGHVMLGTLRQIFISIALLFCIVLILFPAQSVHYPKSAGKLKESTTEGVRNFFIVGLWGMLHLNQGTGGLSGGQLGGVSSVRPDYETDYLVTLVPHDYDRIYLRGYIGKNYVYGENRWGSSADQLERKVADGYDENGHYFQLSDEQLADSTYSRLKEEFDRGGQTDRLRMTIENVDADGSYQCLPYYTELTGRDGIEIHAEDRIQGVFPQGTTQEITYYQKKNATFMNLELFSQEHTDETDAFRKAMDDYVKKEYLSVPEALYDVLEEIAQDADLTGSKQQIVEKLISYLGEHYSYTLRPGLLPWRTDFVTYFLKYNKQGYCAHFATAATLLLRHVGIPARYCEGYAIDYNEILEGEMVEGEDYKDWYTGEAVWGETAVVRVEVPDADAHGWVEVYLDGYGWVPIEVTPAGGEEETYSSFMESFFNMFSRDDEEQSDSDASGGDEQAGIDVDPRVMFGAGLILFLAGLGWVGYRIMKNVAENRKRKTGSDRERMILTFEYGQRFYKQLKLEKKTYETFEDYFTRLEEEFPEQTSCDFLIRTFDQAHYTELSEGEDYQKATVMLEEMIEKVKKDMKLYQKILAVIQLD